MSSASALPVGGEIADFPPVETIRPGFWRVGLVGALSWGALAAVIRFAPDIDEFERTELLAQIAAAFAVLLFVATFGEVVLQRTLPARIRRQGPWLLAIALWLGAWEMVTAKSGFLPRPFFAAPQSLLEVFTDDYARLGDSVWHSLLLLTKGYVIGAAIGFSSVSYTHLTLPTN